MDTLLKKISPISFKLLEYALPIGILGILSYSNIILQPPIMANNLIAKTNTQTVTLQEMGEYVYTELSPEAKRDNFNFRVAMKYKYTPVTNIADGIKHIKMTRYFQGRPVRINIVEFNQEVARDFELRPAIASDTLAHKNTLRTIAQKTNSIVAINGGFFKPQTGVPLGTLMIDKKLYTGPIYDRVAIGIFNKGFDIGRVQLDAKILTKGTSIKIDNINQPRMLSSYVLAYTKEWGKFAPVSPKYGVQIQITDGKITAASANPLPIPENGYVIVGPKSQLSKLFGVKEKVKVDIQTNPKWSNVKHIISGGPYLVKGGELFVDMTAERLGSIGGRNPRTAIGYTKDNDLILVAVDGREGSSVGLTLNELAGFMKSLGCINAINLDGGGSTVMYVKGNIVNHPPQIGGIALSNALVVSKKN